MYIFESIYKFLNVSVHLKMAKERDGDLRKGLNLVRVSEIFLEMNKEILIWSKHIRKIECQRLKSERKTPKGIICQQRKSVLKKEKEGRDYRQEEAPIRSFGDHLD